MKSILTVAALAAIASMCACRSDKAKVNMPEVVEDTVVAVDNTLYGVCGEGTSMNALQLVTAAGDTLCVMLDDGTRHADVQGGLTEGDSMAVVKAADGATGELPLKVVNVTSLLGKWGTLQRHFALKADGSVESNVKEPRPYTHWQLFNGRLVLSQDTFDIDHLGPDSLYLRQGEERIGYRKLN